MTKKAYKPSFAFAERSGIEKYLIFLKQHMLELEPKFYSVVHKRSVDTTNGKMFALRLTTDIEHPGFESIAEGWINGQYIYLWRDHCWGLAVSNSGNMISKYDGDDFAADGIIRPGNPRQNYYDKTILVFKIGIDTV